MDTVDSFITSSLMEYESEDAGRHFSFGSSFNPCPRQVMYGSVGNGAKAKLTFYKRYRKSISGVIRKVVQRTWARQGLLWGDWRCADLKCGVTYQNSRLEGGICIRCGSPAQYSEKIFDDPGFRGRCDAIVFHPGMDGYLIFKLKSRNTNVILRVEEPYPSDVCHASACATLLAREKWLRVIGRVVLWVGTPKPVPYKHWYYPGIGDEVYEDFLQRVQEVSGKMARGEEIKGFCYTAEDVPYNCPYGKNCFGEDFV